MRLVREGLFLGDIMDCIAVLQTPESKITHMLSVFADELLTSNQTFAPGNLCSLCKVGASADDDAPAAPTAGTPQPGGPLLTIPTGIPTNPESSEDTGRRPEVSQNAMPKEERNTKAVESSLGGSGTEVSQDAIANDEGNAEAVESPVGGGTEVGQAAMANDDGKPKVIANGTEVSLRDAVANDDGNVKVVEFPVGKGTDEISLRDAMGNCDENVEVVESPVGNEREVSVRNAMGFNDENAEVVESQVGKGTEVTPRYAVSNDGENAKVVESPVGKGTEVTLRDAMANDGENAKVVESPPGNEAAVTLRDAKANDGENVKVVESPAGNGTKVTLRDVISNGGGKANAAESSSGGGGIEVRGGAQTVNNQQEAVVAKRELVRKTVPLRDMESENLLDHLEVCLEFVEKGRTSGGAVLVHCLAGISRSASVITAYLMRTEKLSLIQALASLRAVSGGVRPNDGFMAQLRMFEEMGCRVDKRSPIYKQFRDTSLAQGAGCTHGLSWLSFLDHINNNNRVQKEDSFRRPSFIKRVYNVARPIKETAEESKVSADIPPSGVSSFRVRIAGLCRRGF